MNDIINIEALMKRKEDLGHALATMNNFLGTAKLTLKDLKLRKKSAADQEAKNIKSEMKELKQIMKTVKVSINDAKDQSKAIDAVVNKINKKNFAIAFDKQMVEKINQSVFLATNGNKKPVETVVAPPQATNNESPPQGADESATPSNHPE